MSPVTCPSRVSCGVNQFHLALCGTWDGSCSEPVSPGLQDSLVLPILCPLLSYPSRVSCGVNQFHLASMGRGMDPAVNQFHLACRILLSFLSSVPYYPILAECPLEWTSSTWPPWDVGWILQWTSFTWPSGFFSPSYVILVVILTHMYMYIHRYICWLGLQNKSHEQCLRIAQLIRYIGDEYCRQFLSCPEGIFSFNVAKFVLGVLLLILNKKS
jgi:hypothetical protein